MKQLIKTLICLCAVLALAGSASAGTARWVGGASGKWEVSTNWVGTTPPRDTGNPVYAYRSDGGASSITINTTGLEKCNDLYLNSKSGNDVAAQATITINDGCTLENSKNVYMYSTFDTSTSTVNVGTTTTGSRAVWNACTTYASGGSLTLASGTGVKSTDTINVYGTLNVKNSGAGAATLKIATSGSGKGYVNIYSSGIVDVDKFTIDGGSGGAIAKIYIYGGGLLKELTTNYTASQLTNIVAETGRTLGTYTDGTKTVIYQIPVPEPATICLLGLGSLILLRRKR